MKKIIVLAASVAMLASCGGNNGLGKEITRDEAIVIAKKISASPIDLNNVECSCDYEGQTYNEEKSANVRMKAQYTLKENADGEFDFHSKTTTDGKTEEYHYYYALNEEYKGVLYINNNGAITVTAATLDETFEISLSMYRLAVAVSKAQLTYANPELIIPGKNEDASQSSQAQGGTTINSDLKYFSKDEKNLTIQAKMSVTYNTSTALPSEQVVAQDMNIYYDNLVFTGVEGTSTSNRGNLVKSTFRARFVNAKPVITLPSDWESKLPH